MNTKRELITFIGLVATYIAAVFLCAFLAFGCSATRLHDKAVKKGYTHSVQVDTLRITYLDTLIIVKGDSVIYKQVLKYRDSLVYQVNTEYIPKWRVRFDNKRFADSLTQIRAMYEAQMKNALKSKKIEAKQTKHKEKHKTKRTQSENKNGFADGMKWLAIFAIILFAWFISIKIHKHIAING
jgi:hypothetical protein